MKIASPQLTQVSIGSFMASQGCSVLCMLGSSCQVVGCWGWRLKLPPMRVKVTEEMVPHGRTGTWKGVAYRGGAVPYFCRDEVRPGAGMRVENTEN